MRRQLDTDFGIAAIAERQGGVASRAQLLRIGLSASAIDRRVQGDGFTSSTAASTRWGIEWLA